MQSEDGDGTRRRTGGRKRRRGTDTQDDRPEGVPTGLSQLSVSVGACVVRVCRRLPQPRASVRAKKKPCIIACILSSVGRSSCSSLTELGDSVFFFVCVNTISYLKVRENVCLCGSVGAC